MESSQFFLLRHGGSHRWSSTQPPARKISPKEPVAMKSTPVVFGDSMHSEM